jgi:hypothetical protein
MIHFTCDRCHCEIDTHHDLRYTVRVDIELAVESNKLNLDDADHLMLLHEQMEELSDSQPSLNGSLPRSLRYDLCANCYRQYAKNPLGREVAMPFGFSQN